MIIIDFLTTFAFFGNHMFLNDVYTGILILLLCTLPVLDAQRRKEAFFLTMLFIFFHKLSVVCGTELDIFKEFNGGVLIAVTLIEATMVCLAVLVADVSILFPVNVAILLYLILSNKVFMGERMSGQVPFILLFFNLFGLYKEVFINQRKNKFL